MRKVFLFVLTVSTASISFSQSCSDSIQPLMAEANEAFRLRTDMAQAQKALDLYNQAETKDPGCVEVLVKGARAAWWVADHASSRDEKIKVFQKGMNWAQSAVAISSHSAEARFWLAGNMGSYGESRGVLKSLFLVKPIRRELETILKIDPGYDRGGAYRVLGVVDYKVPAMAGGSKSRALANLTKAVELGPDVGFNRFYLADYFATVGEKTKALEQLEILKNLKAADEDLPELLLMQEKGRKLETKLKGKSS